MKFKGKKAIIATALSAIVAASAFGTTMASAAVSENSTDSEKSYSISIGSTGQSTVEITNGQTPISSAKVGESVQIDITANSGYKIARIIEKYSDGTQYSGSDYSSENYTYASLAFNMKPVDVTISVITMPINSSTSTPTPDPTPTWKNGDADCNGTVNAADATAVLKHIVGITMLSDQGFKNADMDDNGQITAADATAILKLIISKI